MMARADMGSQKGHPYASTKHAQKRQSQRAISDVQIELIYHFGVDHYQTGGSTLSFIPDRTISQLRAALDRCSGVAIVKGEREKMITTMRLLQKVARTEWTS